MIHHTHQKGRLKSAIYFFIGIAVGCASLLVLTNTQRKVLIPDGMVGTTMDVLRGDEPILLTREFDSQLWRTQRSGDAYSLHRAGMVDDLMENLLSVGMLHSETAALLGEANVIRLILTEQKRISTFLYVINEKKQALALEFDSADRLLTWWISDELPQAGVRWSH